MDCNSRFSWNNEGWKFTNSLKYYGDKNLRTECEMNDIRKQANESKEGKFCKFSEMKVNVLKGKHLQIW